ncbi:P-loop containing nucleoside triphosphate hydrolase protein [Clavulina sp. PMI_390]|nr:P-loop containing nucleoside triphosphate hydrolase protein [Clavulina sp. PMI_390]
MARRVTSDNDSDDEPQAGPSNSKRTPLRSARTPAAQADRDHDDDDPNGEDEESTDSPHGRKRARLDVEGRSAKLGKSSGADSGGRNRSTRASTVASAADDEGQEGENDGAADEDGDDQDGENGSEEEEDFRPQVVTQPRDKDGYVPGSIVRMKLKNFLTYDDAEFRPGPYLNMVIGPNGTGKSSIACAICLGLAFSPKLLGRASEIQSFVKLGAKPDQAEIEIELKGSAGKKNVVIQRIFKATSKSSDYKINGKAAKEKDVVDKVRTLGVRVDNLCSFLPQDRVADFAAMNSMQLLRATQEAAGHQNLVGWHDELIGLSKSQKEANTNYNETLTKLQHERQQNERIKTEVEKFQQRQQLIDELAYWEAVVPWVEYGEAHKAFFKEKELLREAKATFNELLARQHPLLELVNMWEKNSTKLSKKYDEHQAELKKLKPRLAQLLKSYTEAEDKTDNIQINLDKLEKQEARRKEEIAALNKAIEKLEGEIRNPPALPEPRANIDADTEAINHALTAARDAQYEVKQALDALMAECGRADNGVKVAEREHHELTQVTQRRLQNLGKWDLASAMAAKWLEENAGKFRLPIILPPAVSVSVPDHRYQAAIESCFSVNHMKTFVAQTQEDYDMFNECINSSSIMDPRTNKPIRVNVWYRPNPDGGPPPFDPSQLASLGFDGYAMDKIDCPDGIKGFLASEIGLHRTPIALDERRISSDATMQAIGRGIFIAGRTKYTVQRSQYGQKLAFMSTNPVRDARTFKDTSASPAEIQEAEIKIHKAREEFARVRGRYELQQQLLKEKDSDMRRLGAEKTAIDKREAEFQKASGYVAGHQVKLEAKKTHLSDLLNMPSVAQQKSKLRKDYVVTLQTRNKHLQAYNETFNKIMLHQHQATSTALQQIQASVNSTHLKGMNTRQEARIHAASEDFKQRKERQDAEKVRLGQMKQTVTEQMLALPDNIRARFDAENKEGYTSAYVQEQIETFRADLEMNFAVNGHVVEQYRRREQAIKTLVTKEAQLKKNLDRIDNTVAKIRAKWYPALKGLVQGIGERFSAAFDRMGCAGEIRVSETEDYATWTLDILVKFRSSERLQQLTASRQSGGERSLSTILYLMSLTEYARAPFSLVDEINQGMDKRAERAVHDQLVETTCRGDAGQYFLITPKLLPDLTYHRRMRILCINNGDWLPEERIGSLRSLLDNYVANTAA